MHPMEMDELINKILFDEDSFREYLQQLLDAEMIEGTSAQGITKFLMEGNSISDLTDKQLQVFFDYVVGEVNHEKSCENCGEDIRWDDMFDVVQNGEYCGDCKYQLNKLKRE